jgi:hypothetical protein
MIRKLALSLCLVGLFSACSTAYYGAMEKVGFHKRDILVSRVEKASEAQQEAQEQFKSALEQFGSVVNIEETDLQKAYKKLNGEYEDAKDAADEVTERIDEVEDVAKALFKEWKNELDLYQNPELKASSQQKLNTTRSRYQQMMATMRDAEKTMQPVLLTFRDNVLYLKHNLNAQAIGALRSEFRSLESNINTLISRMNRSIESSNRFIADIKE